MELLSFVIGTGQEGNTVKLRIIRFAPAIFHWYFPKAIILLIDCVRQQE
jgi:hypothetical protein